MDFSNPVTVNYRERSDLLVEEMYKTSCKAITEGKQMYIYKYAGNVTRVGIESRK